MAKNINSLQLLRNTSILYESKAAAISGITGSATNDGTIKLARYKETVTSGETSTEVIKTIFGIYSIGSKITGSSVTGGSYTIYDSPQEVIAKLTERLDTLQGDGDKEGSVANSIKTAIEKLDADVTSTTGETFVKVQVVETDGKITAVNVTENDIASAKLLGNIGDTADKDTAFGYIAKEAANRASAITAAIDALDVPDAAVEGSYVSAVSETDGKIAVTRAELPTVAEIKSEGKAIVAVKEDKGVISATVGDIAAAHVTIADASNHFKATTVEAALEELYSQAGAGSKVTVESGTSTEEGVLKVYTIKQGGAEVGKINIPKDLVVESGSVVKGTWSGDSFTEKEDGEGTALKLVIANQATPVYINTLDLVKDHTAGNGINISDTNVVSVVVDPSSEFLSVGAAGVKVSGVSAYVGEEIAKLSGETTSTGGSHVTVKVNEEAGKITAVTVSESDIASASALTNEITARKAVDGINGDAYTAKTGANYISDAGSLFDADVKLDAAIKTNADAIAANKKAIDAEIAARKAVDGQSGNEYVANSEATYISGATSLNDADIKLDTAIKTEAAARKAEDDKIVAGLGFSTGDTNYLIAKNTGAGESLSAESYTVKDAIYTLDDAIAAAKKANTLVKGDNTVVVEKVASGETAGNTSVRVNIASNTNDSHKFVTFDDEHKTFYFTEAILDAGTY